jgi:hypothetical protein
MSQSGIINSSGAPPGDVQSLTPDTGGVITPVGGTIDVVGYPAGSVQAMETYKTANGVLKIADQTWQTQYVVDASTTDGLRGTFTTIQSALNQAEADGASTLNYKTIFIRPGGYTENLVIPNGIILKGDCVPSPFGTEESVIIYGTHNFENSTRAYISNLSFLDLTNSTIFNVTGTNVRASFNECSFGESASGAPFYVDLTGSSSYHSFTDCVFLADTYTGYHFQFNLNDTIAYFVNSFFGTNRLSSTAGVPTRIQLSGTARGYIDNCVGINKINLGAGCYLECYDSSFLASSSRQPDYFIDGSGTGYLSDCDFGSNASTSVFPTSGAAIKSTTGPWVISGLTSYGGIIYEDATVISEGQSTQGDVIQTKATAVDYVANVNDYYIGVTDTSIARTITIPNPTLITEGKIFYVKDESGAAGTNAITIQASGGATIDGDASTVINSNYGSANIIKRGSVYYVI